MRDTFLTIFHILLVLVAFLTLFFVNINNHMFSNLTYPTLQSYIYSNIAKSNQQLKEKCLLKLKAKYVGKTQNHALLEYSFVNQRIICS